MFAKYHCAPLHIKKALGIFRELITTTRRTTTRVAFWDPPSGSKNRVCVSVMHSGVQAPGRQSCIVCMQVMPTVRDEVTRLGGSSFLTEFGICSPNGDEQSISTIECEFVMQQADEYLQSWTYWDSHFFNDSQHGDLYYLTLLQTSLFWIDDAFIINQSSICDPPSGSKNLNVKITVFFIT